MAEGTCIRNMRRRARPCTPPHSDSKTPSRPVFDALARMIERGQAEGERHAGPIPTFE